MGDERRGVEKAAMEALAGIKSEKASARMLVKADLGFWECGLTIFPYCCAFSEVFFIVDVSAAFFLVEESCRCETILHGDDCELCTVLCFGRA